MRYDLKFINYHFGNQGSFLLKRWIDTNYKILRLTSQLYFLKQCKHNNIFPTHLSHICSVNNWLRQQRAIRKFNNTLHTAKKEFLKIEIFDLHRSLHHLNRELQRFSIYLSNFLPSHIWNDIIEHYNDPFDKFEYKLYNFHKTKFNRLLDYSIRTSLKKIKPIRYYCTKETNSKNNNYKFTPFKLNHANNGSIKTLIHPSEFAEKPNFQINNINNSWFINLTKYNIPEPTIALLQLGEKFSLPMNLNKKVAVHEFIKDVEGKLFTSKNNNNNTKIRNLAIPQIQRYLDKPLKDNKMDKVLISMFRTTSAFYKANPNILFTRADKGNTVVAVDRDSYFSNIEEVLRDETTYQLVKKNPSLIIERNLNNFLKKWLHGNYITKSEYFKLHASDSLLPKAYGLPKIHKKNIPYRIIVSSIGTALCPLGTFLHEIISKSIPTSDSHTHNSFDLYKSLSNLKIPESHMLISLDVVSLFTNVPLSLAIDGVSKRWSHISKNTKLPQKEFLEAVEFVLTSTFFTFNNLVYRQTFGTPMGSPLSPIIADIVMQDCENYTLNALKADLIFYVRYVDDIALAAPTDMIDIILGKFNDYHDRLKFTIEYESSRSLNFLDLSLIRTNDEIIIDWFHKETFSGRYISFFSSHPLCHKTGSIYSLVDRAVLLSHPTFHRKNLKLVIDLLLDNGFPLNFIFNKINIRLKKLFNSKLKYLNSTKESVMVTSNEQTNERKCMSIPYIKGISEKVASVLNNDYMVGYRCLNTLGRFIKVQKDKNTLLDNNNVIYKICCRDCDASYVGQTKRKLKTRINEHSKNIKLDPQKHSVISDHILELDHSFDWENAKILDFEPFYYKRLISEMIHIREQKNGLNLKKDTELLEDSYFDILDELARLK